MGTSYLSVRRLLLSICFVLIINKKVVSFWLKGKKKEKSNIQNRTWVWICSAWSVVYINCGLEQKLSAEEWLITYVAPYRSVAVKIIDSFQLDGTNNKTKKVKLHMKYHFVILAFYIFLKFYFDFILIYCIFIFY